VNKRHQKTLALIFAMPTAASLKFGDIENLMLSLGAKVIEGNGSRVAFEIKKQKLFVHRPHPRKEARKYQVEAFREFLILVGVKNE
jgi:HicA toxin of bacterial toxin-antitoxin,